MVTLLGYLILVAILLLTVVMVLAIVSLFLGEEESPEIDLRDIEGPFSDGQNVDHNT